MTKQSNTPQLRGLLVEARDMINGLNSAYGAEAPNNLAARIDAALAGDAAKMGPPVWQTTINATVRAEAIAPAGHEFDGLNVMLNVVLPFIPVAGMMLQLTPDGDYVEVDETYWSIEQPDHIEVFVIDGTADCEFQAAALFKQGWSEDRGFSVAADAVETAVAGEPA